MVQQEEFETPSSGHVNDDLVKEHEVDAVIHSGGFGFLSRCGIELRIRHSGLSKDIQSQVFVATMNPISLGLVGGNTFPLNRRNISP